jgi:hypothetical protein
MGHSFEVEKLRFPLAVTPRLRKILANNGIVLAWIDYCGEHRARPFIQYTSVENSLSSIRLYGILKQFAVLRP